MAELSRFPVRGVLPVFQTPFHEDETVDFDVLQREIEWLFDCGVDGVVMAMVSEVLRLSTDEREEVAARVCQFAAGRGATVISVGAESTYVAERLARHAEASGATAVMAIPPIAVVLGEAELLRYYERIVRSISIPVVVQDASGYVGRPMSIELQAGLLKTFGDRVLFKPEASPIGPRLTQLREATGGRAQVFEGSGGAALLDSHRRGVVGTMPGAELIKAIVALWKALESGDEARAYRLWMPIVALVAIQCNLDGYLAVEKHLLVRQGIFKNTRTRGPVGFFLDDETRREVDRLYDLLMREVDTP
ncbi:MAG: dihydrodipicolinate synthase family protein [Planctomycetota bacterium]